METTTPINGAGTTPAPAKAAKPAKVSKLKAKDPKKAEPSRPKILIYGQPGVGKTWTSLDFPTTYYIDTEGGANRDHYTDKIKKAGGVMMGPEDGANDPATILEQIHALATEEHPYKTLVIDSFTKPFNTEIGREQERLGDKDAFGASKKPAITFARRLVMKASHLDMNMIIICHQKDEWKNGVAVGTTFDGWDKLAYELDLILEIQKQGNSRYALIKKSRLKEFPEGEKFPWSYDEFASRYGKKVMESAAKPIVLATAEQVEQVKFLVDLMKLSDEEIAKWFTKANVESWAEMDTETIGKCIEFLKGKVK